MKLADFIVTEAIIPQLKNASRDEVIRELVESLANAKAIAKADVDEVIDAIIAREKKGSTGFGKGVAVPHVKLAKIKKRVSVIGCSAGGVDFSALDKQPVYSIFLLLSPENEPDGHLQAMENIFNHLNQDKFRRFLRQATTQAAVVDLIQEADAAR
ncbi:MAG: PTS sugar transporter subunit IIA [Phycisphaerae bacterium]